MSETNQNHLEEVSAAPKSQRGDNIIVLNFASVELPEFKEVRGRDYVQYGADNLYPDFLLELWKSAAKHGAIVSGKAKYVAGKGWKTKDGQPNAAADAFIFKVNRYDESLDDINRKISADQEIFYGAYLQVIWNNAGTGIAEIYHVDFPKIRTNKDNTQFFYRESWKRNRCETKVYPAFNPANPRGSQIYFMKWYSPDSGAYPFPEYLKGVNYISAEVEVGKHTNTNSQTGFSASKSITFCDGSDPTDDEKRVISKKLKNKFTGAQGEKFMLNFVKKPEEAPKIDDLGTSDLAKEDFTAVDNLIQSNIYTAHEITTPALFGVATPGSLGQHTELRDGYEIFKNTYVNGKQQFIESHINKIAKYAGVPVPLEIIPTEPIGIDLASVKDIAPKAWLLEQLGIDPAQYPETSVPGAAAEQMEADTNPLLRNITGRQWQGINRIIREVGKGKTTDAAARMLLKSSWGLTDEQIDILLGTDAPGDELKMAEQLSDDDTIAVFAEFGASKEGMFILKSKKVKYCDDADAEMREASFLKFAADQFSELEISILDLIGKDKRITPEVLAEALNSDLSSVEAALKNLTDSGALKVNAKGERLLTKPLKDLADGVKPKTKSFRVMYSYEGPQDSRNRPFCAKLMELDRLYTRVEIEKISARLGYSVWDRRGGFYHNPATGETTPYCRHTWMSHIVMTTK